MKTIEHEVYGTDDGWFFSSGVTREFGQNRNIRLSSGEVVANVVMPFVPERHGDLPVVGVIVNACEPPQVGSEVNAELLEVLKHLVGVIEVHEIDSLDCDNRGEKYCDCLCNAVENAQLLIRKATGETP